MGNSDKGLSISAVLGHNASKWIAEALNKPEQGIKGYHQRLFKMSNFSHWTNAFAYQLDNPINGSKIKPYWDAVNSDVSAGYDVFDSNIWPAYIIPKLNKYYPLKHVIYVTRNGIKWMYSVSKKSSFHNQLHTNNEDSFIMNRYLKQYWKVLDEPWKDWEDWTAWEKICLYWSTSYHMPQWLRDKGIEITVFRMEDLVGGTAIYDLYDLFGLKADENSIQRMQQTNINQHIKPQPIRGIWNTWSQEYKDSFRDVCTDGMDFYDYQVF